MPTSHTPEVMRCWVFRLVPDESRSKAAEDRVTGVENARDTDNDVRLAPSVQSGSA